MYAVIKTGGKQYKVQEGEIIFIEKLNAQSGDAVTFDEVVMVADGEDIKVGTPTVPGAAVTAKVVKNGKGPKVIVFKYKSKKGYRNKTGHRQPYTQVQIEKINA